MKVETTLKPYGCLVVIALAAGPVAGRDTSATLERDAAEQARAAQVEYFEHRVPDSRAPEVGAHLVVDASPAIVYSVVSDYDHFSQFMPGVRSSAVIRALGAVQWVHQVISFPGPLADREFVLRVEHDETLAQRGSYRIRWHLDDLHTRRLRLDRTVVPVTFDGRWELRPLNGGAHTDATYAVVLDPGGTLPAWLTGFASRRLLPSIMRAVAAQSRALAGREIAP